MIFSKWLTNEGHSWRFSVERDAIGGWAAREEQDNRVLRSTRVHDWHRVEQMITLFDLKASALREHGWQEIVATD